ncbi:MAG TPA: hypothetical protein VIY47_10585 [Ignavibacteriaceae bacterium]
MKYILTILLVFFQLFSFSQARAVTQSDTTSGKVSFITTVDISRQTKDGIYMNGYVVNISREKLEKLDGQKIRVTGKVTVVKGVKNLPGEEEQQGRAVDTKHILSPKIEIIKP